MIKNRRKAFNTMKRETERLNVMNKENLTITTE